MTRNTPLQIGDLSRRAGCKIETIRYYERIGLLPAPRAPPPAIGSTARMTFAGWYSSAARGNWGSLWKEYGHRWPSRPITAKIGAAECAGSRQGISWMFERKSPISG